MTSNTGKPDVIYSQTLEKVTDFVFDDKVADVFRDMIGRSVPGYGSLVSMIPVLAREYVQPASHCYDLGCSLGAVTLALRHSILGDDVKIVAVDNSSAMVSKCQDYINNDASDIPVEIICDDIRNIEIIKASFVALNFTLQFITPDERLTILKRIFDGMNNNGVLLLSEKICFDNERDQQWMTDLHVAFKKANGYSDMEISQKRSALENVLIPETLAVHKKRLHEAGFEKVIVWYQCFNFISLLAIK